ncbi:oxidoreductase [Mycobacterium asiaticum]|uniref:Oxidoreductase n=1 Tax=Mycobacterium asiaticum TaxID=1790 RepID=A0A1A3NF50_MYCAS|nr:oxidoreductase [Mycobacterium asiaticum]OBK19699.1 oxidoreductase [Mycobacterium asiaticum]
MAGLVGRLWLRIWQGLLSSRLLTFDGWLAFDLPRTVTTIGEILLIGLATVHVYFLATEPTLPGYFVGYALALIAGCLIAAVALIATFNDSVPQRGWYLGSAVCIIFLGLYLLSRLIALPGLRSLTGRWDVAPATLAMAMAAAFVAVHTTVLSGVNVAYPRRQGWPD